MARSSSKPPVRAGARKSTARSGNPAVRGGSVAASSKAPVTRSAAAPSTPPELPEVLPLDGVAYPQILRNEGYAWWRSLGGAALALSFFLLMNTLVSQLTVALGWVTTGRGTSYRTYYTSAFSFQRASGMLGANLGIAAAIPIAWAVMGFVHRVRPRWLSSVEPRIRWRYLLLCLAVATVALNGVLALSTLSQGWPAFHAQHGFWWFLAVIVISSPIQAAAEEVLFRGYLLQALGSLVATPWFGVVVSSFVFAFLHGSQNLPLFLDRLAFGLLAAVLVWRTGGLEAGIAAHVVNNLFAYLVAALTTSIASLRALQHITWTDAAFDVGGFALFAVVAYLLARRLRLRTRVSRVSVT